MPLLKRLTVMAAKVETTIGTAETLTAAEGVFNAYDVIIQPTIPMETRESQGAFGYLSSVPGGYMGTCTFKTDLGWDGTATEPKWMSVLGPACGLVESTNVWTPRSEAPGSNVKTLTIAAYVNGTKRFLSGAVGDVKFVLPSGKMAYAEFTFTGVWNAPIDATILAPTYPTDLPLRFASATACSFNSVAMLTESITIALNNEIVMRESPLTASGYLAGIITNRRPTVTANPESNLIATQDKPGIWIAQTEAALQITMDGPAATTLAFSAPKAQIINLQQGDRNRLVIDEVEFQLNRNGSVIDTEFAITFTP